ncbi:hypothetical protein Vadar_022423 [Vaccinium darrowii]|uniref:Uncharacterized protein n=1 Tax=Vaccinium darrowii TaxID=229202 RepID=A0ACB7Z5C3_9ERIC|nr:hypothetical protein Vadar_022423 [Vaccinium darrowii]
MALERKEVGVYEVEGVNTQQVIHRALMVASEDNDFLENYVWLSTVVALVKSCVRNELGSRLLELKDLIGSFSASLHHKAYEEGIFLGIYDVSSCLILREIVLFHPTWKTGYLNITLNNVKSVIQKSILN